MIMHGKFASSCFVQIAGSLAGAVLVCGTAMRENQILPVNPGTFFLKLQVIGERIEHYTGRKPCAGDMRPFLHI